MYQSLDHIYIEIVIVNNVNFPNEAQLKPHLFTFTSIDHIFLKTMLVCSPSVPKINCKLFHQSFINN